LAQHLKQLLVHQEIELSQIDNVETATSLAKLTYVVPGNKDLTFEIEQPVGVRNPLPLVLGGW
jgi:hypothetical protein